jgi:hypothetical protein
MRTTVRAIAWCIPALAAAPAGAQEICVLCTGPEATYRCAVAEAAGSMPSAVLQRADRALKYLCAVELARQGHHEKCKARRQSAEPCIGPTRYVSLEGEPDVPPGAAGATPGEAAKAGAEGQQAGSEGPPRTMLELARRTAGASEEQMKKAGDAVKGSASSAGEKLEQAGDAVGGAMKKSWRCLASFFKDC